MQDPIRRTAVRLALLAAAFPLAIAMPSVAADAIPVAIKGYDPVAYFTTGGPVRGLAKFSYEWDEHRYHFSSPEHRELFKTDPVRYVPQFSDFCAMSLTRGMVVEANPEYWLVSEGKLYIFAKAAGPGLFRQNLAENVPKANRNRAKIPAR